MPKEIKIDRENLNGVIVTLKGVMPGNYDSMDRLVNVVNFLEALMDVSEMDKPEEVIEDGG